MKLITFRHSNGHDRAGVIVGPKSNGADVLDLARAFAWREHARGHKCDDAHVADRFGRGVLGFVENAERARPVADELLELHARGGLPHDFEGAPLVIPLASVTLRAPIPRPPSMRDGYAFRQHVLTARKNRGLEMIPEFDQFPIFYFTNHAAVTGPGDVHVKKLHTERLDYELEAAIVVGKEAHDVAAKDATAIIFGMTIMNDWSARALQMEEMKLNLGPAKGKDFATSLGPYLVTLDELSDRMHGDHFDLAMRARVNGKELSQGNVKDMTWTFAQILERASYGVTLYPGDVIGSGTCGTGCLLELNGSKVPALGTDNLWLKPGDVVELEIDRLGVLANKVVLDEA